MRILGVTASSFELYTAFESIATATGTGSSGTITFSSIPSTYQHLQIRYNVITNSDWSDIALQFNSDTASNYNRHYLLGADSTASAGGVANASQIYVGTGGYGTDNLYPTVGIIDIHDYASTNKNKTVKVISGTDVNSATGSSINLRSGAWRSTNAITSITLTANGGYTFNTTSTFALYGIKGA